MIAAWRRSIRAHEVFIIILNSIVVIIMREGFAMKNNKRNALLFLLAAICFLFVGIANYNGRPFTFYGNIIAGILLIIVAITTYRKRNPIS